MKDLKHISLTCEVWYVNNHAVWWWTHTSSLFPAVLGLGCPVQTGMLRACPQPGAIPRWQKPLGSEVLWGILDALFKWIADVYLYHSLLFQAMRWAGLFHVPLWCAVLSKPMLECMDESSQQYGNNPFFFLSRLSHGPCYSGKRPAQASIIHSTSIHNTQ